MKKNLIPILLCFIQGVYAEEYQLNESALHVDARDFALGGLICSFESGSKQMLECTYMIPYQLKELSIRKLVFYKKVVGLDGALEWYQNGNSDWMENGLGLHLGKPLSKQFYLGIEVNVLFIDERIGNYSAACFAQVDCHYLLSEKVSIGLNIMNPSGAQIVSGPKRIPLSCTATMAAKYAPIKSCHAYGEVGMSINRTASVRMGVEYVLNEALLLRTGFSTSPIMPSWGIGGSLNHFSYSWGGNLHPILGMSNGFTLNYNW